MKKWKITVLTAVACAMMAVQPAWAESAVITAGQGMVAGNEESAKSQTDGEAAAQEQTASENAENTVAQETEKQGDGTQGEQTTEAAASENPAEESTQNQGQEETASGETQTAETETVSEETQAQETAGEQAGTARQIDPSKPMVALTFDDGPQPSVGNRIMDCLAKYGGKATFFMVGSRVSSYKTEVQRMVAEGHEVANHTMNHKYLQKLGAGQIQTEVSRGNDAIEAACGVRPTLLRLPGGNHNATVVANTHMPMIQWNVDTLDWKTRNADKTTSAVLDHVKDGDIVLMHELYTSTADAVERIVPELARRGFQMVTVSEMAAARGKSLQAGHLYSEFR